MWLPNILQHFLTMEFPRITPNSIKLLSLTNVVQEADAMSLALVMLLQECLSGAGRDDSNPAHIVGMVSALIWPFHEEREGGLNT